VTVTGAGEHPVHVLAASGFVTNGRGEVLLVRVNDRGWELPGGQVEQGESLVAALRREVEEESGCLVEPERLISVDSRLSPPEMVVHVFACRYMSGIPEAREDAVPEVGWFPSAEALALVTRSPAAERLRDALDPTGAVRFRTYRTAPYELIEERALPETEVP
jgi:8-oxo-dGTP diphosphatase